LYELTTGEFPFEDNNPVAIISQHLHAPVIPPRAKDDEIPPGLNDLILQLLEKNRDDRPASAELVLEALEDSRLLDAEARPERELSVLDRIVRGRIVGRKVEIDEARAVWLKALSSQGQTLLISGEPGIGKTRLMREVIAHAEISGGQTYIGECFAESNAPYSAFAQITRKALQRHQNNSLELPNATIADLLKLVPDQGHLFPKAKPNPELDPESEQQRLLEHMVTFCDLLSQLAPLLFIVEDIHWADSSTLAMFQHLARRTKKMPVMLLSTYREVELKEARPFNNLLNELNRRRIGERIKLNRLTESQTKDMLATIFQDEITPEFLAGIYRETDGNPFFIEEVCRALVESGGVFFKDGAWDRFSIEELEIPQGIQVAVESRLTRMDDICQDVIRMAAVLGREFDVEVLQEALEMEEEALINALETAEGAHMIQETDGKGEVTFAFVHALVPQAIRESIRVLRKRQMHKKAAAAIEKLDPENYESLAHHHSQAGNDMEALNFHFLAGERALKAFANQNAENHLLSALDLVEEDKPKADLLSQLGIAQSRMGKNKLALETWRKAIAIYQELKDYDQAAYLYARSGRTSFDAGDTPGNLSICEKGLEILKGVPASRGMAFLLGEHARALFLN
jgi:predicted ATPase